MMNDKEFERKMAFIVEQQAQFAVDMDRMKEVHAETENVVARLAYATLEGFKDVNVKIDALVDAQIRLNDSQDRTDELIARNAQSIAHNTESIARNTESIARNTESIARNTESIARTGENIARTDENLRRLISTVDRLVDERRGGTL